MELQLKNIGMIKEATVKIDGLTVIAGENDTGKSTVGKMFFALIKSDMISLLKYKRKQSMSLFENRKKTSIRKSHLILKDNSPIMVS